MHRSDGIDVGVGLFVLALTGCGTNPPPSAVPAHLNEPAVSRSETEADGLTPAQRRGREIYRHGTTPASRPIRAVLGGSREPVDAALLACANCHGRDGRGRPEGGIEPPDVTWRALAKPYGSTDRWGRSRPAYTESLLGRVIAMGLDGGGRPLDPAMPRYLLSAEDLADLVSYLTVLGDDLDPGLTPDSIAIGVLVPPESLDPSRRRAILGTMEAYAESANRRGGLYNRRLVVQAEDLDPSATAAVGAFLERRPVFALVAADIRGVEEEVTRVVEDRGVPLIGPFANRTPSSSSQRRQTFYLHAGLEEQARATARDACRSASNGSAIAIRSDDPASIRAEESFIAAWKACGRGEPARATIPESAGGEELGSIVARLLASKPEVVAYFGPRGALRGLLDASWRPVVYVPGSLMSPDLFERPLSFGGRVRLALPSVPEDMSAAGKAEFDRLRSEAGLPGDHLAVRMAVLAALKVFEEGVGRSGRDLSRAGLVEAIERLRDFPTGFSRPLTFGPTRRVGSAGAYFLAVDLASGRLQPSDGWVEAGRQP